MFNLQILAISALLSLAAAAPGHLAGRQEWGSLPKFPAGTQTNSISTTTYPTSTVSVTTSTTNPTGIACDLGPANATTYTVVSGDTLTNIADKFGIGICDIQAANAAQVTGVNFIYPGEVLNIPSGLCSIDNTSCLPRKGTQPCLKSGPLSFTVVSGDTLTTIGSEFDLTLQVLENANQQVTNPDLIEIGQVLNLPQCICATS